jgi:hypothetical protein
MLSPTWPEPHTHTSPHWLTEQLQQIHWPSNELELSLWSRDVLSEGFCASIIFLLLNQLPVFKKSGFTFSFKFFYLNAFEFFIYLRGIFFFWVKTFFNLGTKHKILRTRRTKIWCRIWWFTYLARLMIFTLIINLLISWLIAPRIRLYLYQPTKLIIYSWIVIRRFQYRVLSYNAIFLLFP